MVVIGMTVFYSCSNRPYDEPLTYIRSFISCLEQLGMNMNDAVDGNVAIFSLFSSNISSKLALHVLEILPKSIQV